MTRTPPWLQSILEEHFEEVQMLWELRQAALKDPDYTGDDLRELDERIEAHVDGLVLSREDALPMILEGLSAGEYSAVFAAAFALLRCNDPGHVTTILDTLLAAEDDGTRDGIADALCHGPLQHAEPELRPLLQHQNSAVAVVAAAALAFHGQLDPQHPRLSELILDDDPAVRQRGWRTVSCIGR